MPVRSSPIDERQIDEIVGIIYDAALDAEVWRNVLASIARGLSADHSIMAAARRPAELGQSAIDEPIQSDDATGLETTDLGPYFAYFDRIDPCGQHAVRSPPGSGFSLDDLLRHAVFTDSGFAHEGSFADWLQPNGAYRVFGSYVALSDVEFLALGFHSNQCGRAFGAKEQHLLDALIPHLKRSLQIGVRLEGLDSELHAARAVLDELTVGVALLDASGHVLNANQPLLELASRRDGLRIAPDGLHASSASTTAVLRRLVMQALSPTEPASGAMVIERPSERRALQALVVPLRAAAAGQTWKISPRAIVLITDPELHSTPPPELLRLAFGLTGAEARVAIRLARGDPLGSIAQHLGVQIVTVRNQLKQIFQKTGTHRQAELVSLLYAGPLDVHHRGE
jgi:DNA-binding CsgD family transcriptional regulator